MSTEFVVVVEAVVISSEEGVANNTPASNAGVESDVAVSCSGAVSNSKGSIACSLLFSVEEENDDGISSRDDDDDDEKDESEAAMASTDAATQQRRRREPFDDMIIVCVLFRKAHGVCGELCRVGKHFEGGRHPFQSPLHKTRLDRTHLYPTHIRRRAAVHILKSTATITF